MSERNSPLSQLDVRPAGDRIPVPRGGRVLLVRLSAIGDCLATLPLATRLKALRPDLHITWVFDCGARDLIARHPAVDDTLRLPKGFLKRPSELWQTAKLWRREKFDLAIDVQGLLKSAVLTWLSGARCRLGFDACGTREGAWRFYHEVRHPLSEHIITRQVELLEALEFSTGESQSDIAGSEQVLRSAAGHHFGDGPIDHGWRADDFSADLIEPGLNALGVRPGGYVVINPGASWSSKLWSVERYAAVADAIRKRFDLPSIVVWSSKAEADMARTICMLAPEACRIAPSTTLVELAALIRSAELFIGSDTGPMHLAVSVGTPCVAMFGTTLPSKSGPLGAQHVALQCRYDGGSSRYRRRTTNAAMLAIPPQMVIEAASGLLDGRRDISVPSVAAHGENSGLTVAGHRCCALRTAA